LAEIPSYTRKNIFSLGFARFFSAHLGHDRCFFFLFGNEWIDVLCVGPYAKEELKKTEE
jgi:hypothetical protein